MKITLAEIARLSGVSKTTASLVLNGKQTSIGISPETVEKVKKVMDAFHYRKNEAAAALAGAKRRKVKALMLSPWFNDKNSFFMNEVMRAAADFRKDFDFDYDMYLPGEPGKGIGKNRKVENADWIITTGTSRKDEGFIVSSPLKEKFVLLNRKTDGATCFSIDNFAGGRMLAEHCTASGYYEEFVIITGYGERSNALSLRIEGMVSGLRIKKIQPHIINIENGEEIISVAKSFSGKRLMIFAQIDIQAAHYMSALLKDGFDIPGEIGISGFDHEPVSEIMTPSISTVDSKTYEVTCSALKNIICETITPGKQYLFKPELIARESTR